MSAVSSQHLGSKQRSTADDLVGHHEHAVAGIVQRLGMLRRRGDVRLHHLECEEIVFVDQRIVVKSALEAGMAFAYERRIHPGRVFRREAERGELVDLGPLRVADPNRGIGQRRRRQVDHALPTLADHAVAVIAAGDHQADQRRREFRDPVPAESQMLVAPCHFDDTSTIRPGSR